MPLYNYSASYHSLRGREKDMNTTRIDTTTSEAYKLLSPSKKRQWRRMTKYLKSYSETRSKSVSATHCGVSYRTSMKWQASNEFGFTERLEDADILFCENLEQLALDRVKMQDAKANPVLLITLLNANLPQKYRPTVVMSDDTAKDVLKELRTLANDVPVVEKVVPEEVSAVDEVTKILNERGGMA
jgi:hypothetical protein